MTESFPLPDRLAAILDGLPLEELAFTPVPVKARHDGWTPERQQGFILRLALGGCPGTAARSVGKSRESAYRLRAHAGAESFAAAWDRALGWGRDYMTDQALERALLGEVRPYFYRGRKCGEYVRHDNRLAMSVLNRLDRKADRAGTADPAHALRACLAGLGSD